MTWLEVYTTSLIIRGFSKPGNQIADHEIKTDNQTADREVKTANEKGMQLHLTIPS